jgi:hypothetical protein
MKFMLLIHGGGARTLRARPDGTPEAPNRGTATTGVWPLMLRLLKTVLKTGSAQNGV